MEAATAHAASVETATAVASAATSQRHCW
jgi:hypothetical protein